MNNLKTMKQRVQKYLSYRRSRKNWLISGSPRGAHASALFYSLIATAKSNDLNPFDYFKVLFEKIRFCKTAEDYANLLPFNLKIN